MLIPNQYFDIKITKKNIEHYKSLGYNVKLKDIINVPAEHLSKGSNIYVEVSCDICGRISNRQYCDYIKCHTYDLDVCPAHATEKRKIVCMDRYNCEYISQVPEFKEKKENTCLEKYGVTTPLANKDIQEKIKQQNLKKYGVEYNSQREDVKIKREKTFLERFGCSYPAQSESVKEKMKKTSIERYGTEIPAQNEEIKNKIKQTNMERYGVPYTFLNDDIKQKAINTILEKYGVDCVLKSPEIQNKIRQTNLEKYGYENVWLSPEIQSKIAKTQSENFKTKTSSQQNKLYSIIKSKYQNAELNYPFSQCSLDIFIYVNGINIDIEYDGRHWHQDQQADIRRDKFLQSQGFKVLRIRSGHQIPTEEQLFLAIDELIRTNRIFKEIILPDWDKQYKINEGQEVSA